MILVLPMWQWNCQIWEKKFRVPLNVTKVWSKVMLVLYSVKMELSNVRKKKGTIECEKSTDRCHVGTA